MGVFSNGTTYPLYDNYRPVQQHNYTQRPVYECGEQGQEPMVGACDAGDDDEDAELRAHDEMWYIIGIVFIVLFGISVVIIAFLLWKMDCCTAREKPSSGYDTVQHDETELVPRTGKK